MRTIKFRAWDKQEKKFVYTDPYVGYVIHNNKMCSNDYGDLLGNDDFEAPEQFTGLYDKNGKEIYEGDVIMDEMHCGHYTPIFENGSYYFKMVIGGAILNDEKQLWTDFDTDGNNTRELEIIGNVHEVTE